MNHVMIMNDTCGKLVRVRHEEVIRVLMLDEFRLFGMSTHVMLQVRAEYVKRGGKMPMTEASVREIFAR